MTTAFGSATLPPVIEELRALLKVGSLVPFDLTPRVPSRIHRGEDLVVFVHGTLATAGAFRPMRKRLAELISCKTASFSFLPGVGVEHIAASLRRLLDRLPTDASVHLVGHSLGGLAIRWYVQETGPDPRVVQTVSIAAPFHGARAARLMPGQQGRDMEAGSRVLCRLVATAAEPALPHLSIYGQADTTVPASTTYPVGERVVIDGAGHNALLFDPRVADHVAERIRRFAAVPRSTG